MPPVKKIECGSESASESGFECKSTDLDANIEFGLNLVLNVNL